MDSNTLWNPWRARLVRALWHNSLFFKSAPSCLSGWPKRKDVRAKKENIKWDIFFLAEGSFSNLNYWLWTELNSIQTCFNFEKSAFTKFYFIYLLYCQVLPQFHSEFGHPPVLLYNMTTTTQEVQGRIHASSRTFWASQSYPFETLLDIRQIQGQMWLASVSVTDEREREQV